MKSPAPSSAKNSPPLPPSFYLQSTIQVARQLLGKGLFLLQKGVPLLAEIVEVEAYLGRRDPASHAYRGETKRNWAMFEAGGTCYVYLSYGLNFCMNVATRAKGEGEAVLFRAAIPLLGLETMAEHRGIVLDGSEKSVRKLMSGPGKLTEALGIDLGYNGLRFDRQDFKLVDLGKQYSARQIGTSSRIGISKAKDEPLRFFVKSCDWLSRKEK